MKILVTGGLGFIGSALIRKIIDTTNYEILNIDSITYAAMPEALENRDKEERYSFKEIDIADFKKVEDTISQFKPNKIFHLAAESHVDRSITDPSAFIKTNIIGTFNILQSVKALQACLPDDFTLVHVSTDEVFGSLNENDKNSTEDSSYKPNSPYSASKAGADHLVRAFHQTYKIPVITTNCSNNYGPFQNKEKLIPTIIKNAMNWKSLPIYGDGKNIRDWIYVLDHCSALDKILEKGEIGETYNIGGNLEMTNIEIVKIICKKLDEVLPHKNGSYSSLISFVEDRLGHDKKYALNCTKLIKKLKWSPVVLFEDGILKTIEWYINNNK